MKSLLFYAESELVCEHTRPRKLIAGAERTMAARRALRQLSFHDVILVEVATSASHQLRDEWSFLIAAIVAAEGPRATLYSIRIYTFGWLINNAIKP